MTFARKALVAAVAIAASSLTLAEGQTNTGFYLAIDAGQATLSPSIKLDNVGDGSVGSGRLIQSDQENATYTLGVGYAFNDYVAVELGYTSYGDSEDIYYYDDGINPPTATISEVTDIQSVNLSILAGMPMGEDFSMYFRGGYGAWDMDARVTTATNSTTDDWNKVGINYGFGFKLDMTDNLSLRNEYLWYNFDDEDIDLDTETITLGLVFTF